MNPLIQRPSLKNEAIDFTAIKPEHFGPAIDHAISVGHAHLKTLKTSPAGTETLRLLECAGEELELIYGTFRNLLSAHSNDELRALAPELGAKVAAFGNDILFDSEVFQKIKALNEQRAKYTGETAFYIEKLYRDFKLSGAELDEEKKNKLRAIDERLAAITPKFQENVLKSTNEFELWIEKESDLAGLPESARTAAKEAATQKGKAGLWLFTLHHPSYVPFITYADNRELREKMYRAYVSRAASGPYDNQKYLVEMVQLMHDKAALTGQPSYADYVLQNRMAGSTPTVRSFLDKMHAVVRPAAEKELKEVQEFARSLNGPEALQVWDFAYYSEKLKQKKYAFDSEALRPYLKLENVTNGVFELMRRLFDLRVQESSDYPVYHPDVKVFEVSRAGNGEFVGLLYADFFPRESKAQGAWMTNYREQGIYGGKNLRPHVGIVCNFTKPTKDKPSLLTFQEVRTLFHELGHALHSLLSKVEYRSLAGTNVYWDFVEFPSQIMENWSKEKEMLDIYARHYQTNEVLPADLMKRLLESQKFQAGSMALRQLSFCYLDFAWYGQKPPNDVSVKKMEDESMAACRVLPPVKGVLFSAAFTHIFGGGYAAGYYSYKWAEALEADAFEAFKERGLFHKETAKALEEVLSKGGSEHPMRLFEKFRGRQPDPSALLRRDGLL